MGAVRGDEHALIVISKTQVYLYEMIGSSQIILHVIRSPLGIDWTSPRALLVSTLKNQIAAKLWSRGHPIGHVHVELLDQRGSPQLLTGITIKDRREYVG